MTLKHWLLLVLAPALSLAQVPDPAQQGVIEQLKGVRAALERLEKSNELLLILTRIQIDESRLATLEAQRQGLQAMELNLGPSWSARGSGA